MIDIYNKYSYIFFISIFSILLLPYYFEYEARKKLKGYSISSDKERAEIENEFIKTAAQVLGGIAVLITFVYNLNKDNELYHLTIMQSAATTYAEATKLLNEANTPIVRASAIYLLEQVALLDVNFNYKESIANTLVAFIHSQGKKNKTEKDQRVNADVRAAIHVLGRTAEIPISKVESMNLDNTFLAGADFENLKEFRGRRFQGADLRSANFKKADLSNTRFSGVNMNDYCSIGSTFKKQTREWKENKRHWYVAVFNRANLRHAKFEGAGLAGVIFEKADLYRTNFKLSELTRADFTDSRNIEFASFEGACADEAPTWPKNFHLRLPKCKGSKNVSKKIDGCGYKILAE